MIILTGPIERINAAVWKGDDVMLGARVKLLGYQQDLWLLVWKASPCGKKAWDSFRHIGGRVTGLISNVVQRAVVAEVKL